MENGPYVYSNTTHKLQRNKYSWNTEYDIVYIDQPVGTGLSSAKDAQHYCMNETCVAADFYRFLIRFLEVYHFEYIRRPIYIVGESYAGHYIPAIAEYILRSQNKAILLEGIAIGNGLVDMSTQFLGYADYLREKKLVGPLSYFSLKFITLICHVFLKYRTKLADTFCTSSLDYLQDYAGIINPYDIRRSSTDEPVMKLVSDFMNDCDIQALYGIKECKKIEGLFSTKVKEYMKWEFCTSYTGSLEILLESVKVLLYYGTEDYRYNWKGGELLVNALNWKGKHKFSKAKYKKYYGDSLEIGEYKMYDRLAFMKIFNAGNMVPKDQGKAALHMINDFINDYLRS
eukprot:TRINITY_DN3508_c0_g1_i2.p1 TRINITY_DN3508_c0_g1~~TRINITY_DN3508_c0_g1_i2.p1  ORF type:complete len:343 (+),score=46.23 TRINITY_DN3508_c0_g1_i2:300-1328(+)